MQSNLTVGSKTRPLIRQNVFYVVACTLAIGLTPVTTTAQESNHRPSDHANGNDRFATHVERLRDRLPNEEFHILIQPPFVVIGDESLDKLKGRSKRTVAWAVEHLKSLYFEHDPDHIIDIWLYKDKHSYEKHVQQLHGRKPGTPFGYYSSRHRSLVMNISTGGGTLVHEIVHPFIEKNFPNCPSWFNEGLASLYEQCREHDGKIWGSTNWRLSGLQRAIRNSAVPDFEDLCGTSTRQFYEEDSGTNYAQARYLCYYLQEHGKLQKFYQQFCKNIDEDSSGYSTLQSVLGRDDMDEFQKEWEAFVISLRYR